VLGVKPRKEQIEKERAWNDPKIIEVPNLIGLTKKDLQQQLFNLKLDVSGEGDVVVEQAPEPGAKVKEGATIRIYLAKKTPASKEKAQ
jgi:stage V sporulation protein D (sporulation-specific penicillin-binding protein)